jgi:hypothetical protein
MHGDHEIFVKSIQDKNKVKLIFVINERGDIREGLFGPIFYSASIAGDDSDCYYLWDFESGTSNHFLGIPSSQIMSMELSKETFDLVEFFTSKRETSEPHRGSEVNLLETKRKESNGKSL